MINRTVYHAFSSAKSAIHKSILYPFLSTYVNIHKPALLTTPCIPGSKDATPLPNHSIPFITDKRLITVSSGGFLGFYMSGVCKYLKIHYNLDDVVFSGASAGAWISLILTYKGDPDDIYKVLLSSNVFGATSISHVEELIKKCLLANYTTDDFDLVRLYIGVTTFQHWSFEKVIYTNFDNLEDAIDCCVASSHIPFLTGGLTHTYRNVVSFDGGFSHYPYLNSIAPTLHITPEIWNKNKKDAWKLENFTTLLSSDKYNFTENLNEGYRDTLENKHITDLLFIGKNKEGCEELPDPFGI